MPLNFKFQTNHFVQVALLVAFAACTDAPMTPRIIPGEGKPLASLSVTDLDARQEALLGALLEDAPAAEQGRTRALLLRALENGTPLEARGAKYAALTAALNATTAEKHSRNAKQEPEPEMVRVSVGLVASFKKEGIRSTVLRRPGDDGVPVLLLLESATAEDLTAGLSAARHSFKSAGRSPSRAMKLESPAVSVTPGTAAAGTLQWIKARIPESPASQKLPGYGTIRLVPVATPATER
jgi:hypothetical protein